MKFKNFLSLIGFSLTGMHLINKYVSKTAKSLFFHNKYNDYTYNWTYGNIFYTKQGMGAPLLLIHDLTPASSTFEWQHLITEYAKTNTVYALDLLGCGFSDKPNLTYTNYLFVKLINDFINDIVKSPCTVITSGNSSTIALMSTLPEDNQIEKIIMINPSNINNEKMLITQQNKINHFIFRIPILGTFISNNYNSRENLEELFYNSYLYKTYDAVSEYADAYYSSYHHGRETSKSLFASIYNNYTNMDFTIALKQITIPICIIFGEGKSNYLDTLETYKKYTNVEYDIIPETKHLPALERPQELIKKINSYI